MQDEDTKDISHDVFISYATDKDDSSTSKDFEVAEKVCTALESQDIRCWIAPRKGKKGGQPKYLAKIFDFVLPLPMQS
jgi:hypothetical protein